VGGLVWSHEKIDGLRRLAILGRMSSLQLTATDKPWATIDE
jgi:hypothetical protein